MGKKANKEEAEEEQEAGRDRQTYWPCYQSRQLFLWEPTLRMCNEWLI